MRYMPQDYPEVSTAGVIIGANAALISIITKWLSDIKMGYCADGWWLNQQFCCWEIDSDDEFCPSWHPWSTAILARWLLYVMFAVWFPFPDSCHLIQFVGSVFICCSSLGSHYGEVCCWLGDLRNQMYPCRVCDERFSWLRNVRHQKYYSCAFLA